MPRETTPSKLRAKQQLEELPTSRPTLPGPLMDVLQEENDTREK